MKTSNEAAEARSEKPALLGIALAYSRLEERGGTEVAAEPMLRA
jgi:hypothetical protein